MGSFPETYDDPKIFIHLRDPEAAKGWFSLAAGSEF